MGEVGRVAKACDVVRIALLLAGIGAGCSVAKGAEADEGEFLRGGMDLAGESRTRYLHGRE